MNKEKLICDYRSFTSYLIVAVLVPISVFMVYTAIRFVEGIFWGIAFVLLLVLFYYVMVLLNKRVILTEEYVEEYNLFGKVKRYDLCDITQITVRTEHRERYVILKSGMKKVKIHRQARNYDEFESMICKLFNLKGYSRGGTHTYDL